MYFYNDSGYFTAIEITGSNPTMVLGFSISPFSLSLYLRSVLLNRSSRIK